MGDGSTSKLKSTKLISITDAEEETRQIAKILASSTIILFPDIPHSQINCHDYGTITPFLPLIENVIDAVPEIDFVVLIATGGLKARFIDMRNEVKLNGAEYNRSTTMRQLGELYVEKHDLLKQVFKKFAAFKS